MIMRSDFTMEELKKDTDPLSYVCHSIAKLKMFATVIQENSSNTKAPPFEVYRADDVRAMGEYQMSITLSGRRQLSWPVF